MKKLIILFIVISQSIIAQTTLPFDASNKITYTENVSVPNINTDELYLRLKTWVVENYLSPGKAVQKDDTKNQTMVISGTGNCYSPKSFGDTLLNGWFNYTLTVNYKDGGYTYTMTDFYSDDKWKGMIPSETWKGSKKQKQIHDLGIQEVATALTTSLKASMSKKLVVGSDN